MKRMPLLILTVAWPSRMCPPPVVAHSRGSVPGFADAARRQIADFTSRLLEFPVVPQPAASCQIVNPPLQR
eukprot:132981-Rhodomonas_salina.3